MINKLKEEYSKRRFSLYKKTMLNTIETVESRKSINRKIYIDAIKSFCEKLNVNEYYECLVEEVDSYLRHNNITNTFKTKPYKVLFSLYKFTMAVERWRIVSNDPTIASELNLFNRLISFFKEDNKTLFIDFADLNELLDTIAINKNEKADFILEIIRLNSERFKSGDFIRPLNIAAIDVHFKHPLYKPIVNELADYWMLDNIDDAKVPFLKSIKKRIKKIDDKYPILVEEIIENCSNITSIINEGNVLDDEVSASLLSSLEYLGVKHIYNVIISRAKKEIKQANLENKQFSPKKCVSEETVKPAFSKKDINKIFREIKEVYDFDNETCKKLLTMDEIIEVLSKLIIINADKRTIDKFLYVAEKNLRQNPVAAYSELLDKAKTTISDESALLYIDEAEKLIEDLYQNAASEEKCIQIIEELDRCIRLINNSLANDYTYEYNKAKKLIEGAKYGESKKGM